MPKKIDGLKSELLQDIEFLTDEELAQQEYITLVLLARLDDGLAGFKAFYELIQPEGENELPEHGLQWIEAFYEAKKQGKGIVLEAFRGSTKSTILTKLFTAFRIGHEPHKSNLLIQVSDDQADKNTDSISEIIENVPAWKAIFPHVVPDKEKGWSTKGYEVKRTDMEYPQWRALNAGRKDPTLMGKGYASNAIIGMHPSGLLIVDDIHDETNTSSRKELEKTLKIFTGTIIPMITQETWVMVVGTPWVTNDVLAYAKATGEFINIKTPIMKDGKPIWKFRDVAWIEKMNRMTTPPEFARMFLLDLTAAQGKVLKKEWLHEYPSDKVGGSWPVYIGLDYASVKDKIEDVNRDYFTIAVIKGIPGGGGILVDGYRGQLLQAEAESIAISWGLKYPYLKQMTAEAIGKGEEFHNLLMRKAPFPVIPIRYHRRSKGERFEKGMAPYFYNSQLWVSDQPNDFINEFKKEWVAFPDPGTHDDCLDAVYMCTLGMQGQLSTMREDYTDVPRYEKKRQENPYCAFGRQ